MVYIVLVFTLKNGKVEILDLPQCIVKFMGRHEKSQELTRPELSQFYFNCLIYNKQIMKTYITKLSSTHIIISSCF